MLKTPKRIDAEFFVMVPECLVSARAPHNREGFALLLIVYVTAGKVRELTFSLKGKRNGEGPLLFVTVISSVSAVMLFIALITVILTDVLALGVSPFARVQKQACSQ